MMRDGGQGANKWSLLVKVRCRGDPVTTEMTIGDGMRQYGVVQDGAPMAYLEAPVHITVYSYITVI